MKKSKLYEQFSSDPFKLSRSKIDLFCECPCCFYLDRKLGVPRPSGFPFNLNNAVDHLLKKEFDLYREKMESHPLMVQHKINAIPFNHEKRNDWRNNKRGVSYLHEATQFHVYGALDELWVNPSGELFVVDFKATSKKEEVGIDADWQISYKRQMEVYQWLLRNNGFKVSNTGYFVYCNGIKAAPKFDQRLDFKISVIPYVGDDQWIEPKLHEIHNLLAGNEVPTASPICNLCTYRNSASNAQGLFKNNLA